MFILETGQKKEKRKTLKVLRINIEELPQYI